MESKNRLPNLTLARIWNMVNPGIKISLIFSTIGTLLIAMIIPFPYGLIPVALFCIVFGIVAGVQVSDDLKSYNCCDRAWQRGYDCAIDNMKKGTLDE